MAWLFSSGLAPQNSFEHRFFQFTHPTPTPTLLRRLKVPNAQLAGRTIPLHPLLCCSHTPQS